MNLLATAENVAEIALIVKPPEPPPKKQKKTKKIKSPPKNSEKAERFKQNACLSAFFVVYNLNFLKCLKISINSYKKNLFLFANTRSLMYNTNCSEVQKKALAKEFFI